MKAIIFGANGQDGVFLSRLLLAKDIQVIGVSRSAGDFIGDVSDYAFTEVLIKDQKPDYIFHLAANSTTQHSALFDNHQTISTGTLNILESVRKHCREARVFLAGSAMQFLNNESAISEQTPFEASSPYSIARIQSTYAGRYYRDTFGMNVYVGYLFNHDSPLRTERHVNQKIVSAVNRIKNGSEEKLELGDVDVEKEFNYAGDVVEAIWTLVNQTEIFEIVVGSGESHSIRDWTKYCFSTIGRHWEDYVLISKTYRPEYKMLISNPALLYSLGWRPQIGFEMLADLMLKSHDHSL